MIDIANVLEEYLVASKDKYPRKKLPKFYVSDMGKCLRMRWVKRKGVISELSPDVTWLLEMGNLGHEFGYKVLEAKGLLVACEESVRNEHFSGRFDGLVKGEEDKLAPFDFKMVKSYKIKMIKSGELDELSLKQLFTYSIMLRDGGRKDIGNEAAVIYMNKEPGKDSDVPAFYQATYLLNERREEEIRGEMDKLTDYWVKDKVPPCTCVGWMKDYNNYAPFCGMNDLEVEEVLKKNNEKKKLITTKEVLYLVDGEERKELVRVK